jgi:hypothetical protein
MIDAKKIDGLETLLRALTSDEWAALSARFDMKLPSDTMTDPTQTEPETPIPIRIARAILLDDADERGPEWRSIATFTIDR